MDQKRIHVVVILVFYQLITSGANAEITVKEGTQVEISCNPEVKGTITVWFRSLDKSGMEFIASFSSTGTRKETSNPSSTFTYSNQNSIKLNSFRKDKDSGAYTCASLYKGNELRFGKVTRLVGEKTPAPQVTTPKPDPCTTAPACVCNTNAKKEETSPSLVCTPIILGPLVGGCGLLLLLLIVTILYCNKIRTRRCPHHYKRKPRMMAGEKQVMTNRHI